MNYILCITDEPTSSRPWRQAVERSFPEIEYGTADAVLERRALDSFELLLIDAHTIGDRIVRLSAQLRQRFRNPVIVMVPKHEEKYLLRLYDTGASDCITQAIDPALLVAKLKSWLRWTAPRETGEAIPASKAGKS